MKGLTGMDEMDMQKREYFHHVLAIGIMRLGFCVSDSHKFLAFL